MSLDLAFGLGPATLGLVAAATGRGGLFLVAAGVAAIGLTLVVTARARPALPIFISDGQAAPQQSR